jgi:hypothetical protein
MAEVERQWFRKVFASEQIPYLNDYNTHEDADLLVDGANWESDLASWQSECEAARSAAAGRDLNDCGERRGEAVSLRWVYNHMIEEYARHNGHADLIRELVDGTVGC